MNDFTLLVGRLLLAAIYVDFGAGHVTGITELAATLAAKGLPLPMVAAIIAAAAEFGGGLAIALGWKTKVAAIAVLLFTIAAAVLFHNFWTVADPQLYQQQFVQFMKNVGLCGGLLLLYAAGPGRFSIDGVRGH